MYDAIILGAGQAGPTLASRLTAAGQKVALVEREKMGGCCVNYGCTPTKALVANAKIAHSVRCADEFGIEVRDFSLDMNKIQKRKEGIVSQSREGLRDWLVGMEGCDVYEGHATFQDPHHIAVGDKVLEGKKIFINVGGRAFIPPGFEKVPYLTNVTILELDVIPEHLLIVGGGYVAVEFAQIFRRFGSRVTLFQRHAHLMPKEDVEVSEAVRQILEKEGVEVQTEVQNLQAISREGKICVNEQWMGSHLLLAAGRVPNTDQLDLEKAGVALDGRRFIQVNEQLQTSQPHIWALGDCNGKGAFTHTAYNDYEIVADNLLKGENRSVQDRFTTYALFLDPPLGRVGMTEKEARASEREVLMAQMPMTRVARAIEKGETDGFLKVLVDRKNQQILGASLLGTGCDEVVQILTALMYAKAPYTILERAVFIHPTVSELLPTLFSELKPLVQESSYR